MSREATKLRSCTSLPSCEAAKLPRLFGNLIPSSAKVDRWEIAFGLSVLEASQAPRLRRFAAFESCAIRRWQSRFAASFSMLGT